MNQKPRPREEARASLPAEHTERLRSENEWPLFTDEEWHLLVRNLGFSPREQQVVHRLMRDDKELAIALDLGISQHTVHTHVERVYRKLGVRSRAELLIRLFAAYLELDLN